MTTFARFLSRGLRYDRFMIVIAVLIVLLSSAYTAFASTKMLMLHPTRIIFTDRQRSIVANVINRSDEPITYSISLVSLHKGQNGKLTEVEVESEEDKRIKKMIRYSPRRATIQPKQRQVVKLMVRKPKGLEPGEYRTFIKLSPHPSDAPPNTVGSQTQNSGKLNVDLLVTTSMPIIIQHEIPMGEVTPQTVELVQSSSSPSGMAVNVMLSRSGVGSAFGDVNLELLPVDSKGKPIKIGKLNGIAIYEPAQSKKLTIQVDSEISLQQLRGGKLRVSFQPKTGIQSKRRTMVGERSSKVFSF